MESYSQDEATIKPENKTKSSNTIATASGQPVPFNQVRIPKTDKFHARPSAHNAAGDDDRQGESSKRRAVVSSACLACRRRKSKCDGATPSCAACASVYGTPCVYSPDTDHRRKGVYKKDIDNLKTRNSTLQTLVSAILNYPEDEVSALVSKIRTCESLDSVAERILARDRGQASGIEDGDWSQLARESVSTPPTFETQLSGKLGAMRIEEGSTRYFGGTSHLIWTGNDDSETDWDQLNDQSQPPWEDPVTSWSEVTNNKDLVMHLLNNYFSWHYQYFCTLPKALFWQDFLQGRPPPHSGRKPEYCSPLLVNSMLALGSHFTSWPEARENPQDSATAGDQFFREAKRLLMVFDEYEHPKLTTVQALALMSVREAGCGREAKGWVYSGMSFRMACDLGLNLDSGAIPAATGIRDPDHAYEDARRITFWGCFLFDKCWSNYLGRMPQLPTSLVTIPRFEVFPEEDGSTWSAYGDSGFNQSHAQPARTRAVALQICYLCEISSDLMASFYNPLDVNKPKGKQAELKKLSDLHQRLENWKRALPKELEPREGSLPHIIIMHMFFQLLYLHLFRPFLKYRQEASPLPPTVSSRKMCTQAATTISKLMRLYKRTHGIQQICNIVVYIVHSACTIHLLNLPDKNARRDIIHGVKHLEEIGDYWLCARRTISILRVLANRWKVELPDEASAVIARAEARFGVYKQRSGSISYARKSPSQDETGVTGLAATHIQAISPDFSGMRPSASFNHYIPGPGSIAPTTYAEINAHTAADSTNTTSTSSVTAMGQGSHLTFATQQTPSSTALQSNSRAPPIVNTRDSIDSNASAANSPNILYSSEGVSPADNDWWRQTDPSAWGSGTGAADAATSDAWMTIVAGGNSSDGGAFARPGQLGTQEEAVHLGQQDHVSGQQGVDVLSGVGGLNALNAYNMAPYEEDWYRT